MTACNGTRTIQKKEQDEQIFHEFFEEETLAFVAPYSDHWTIAFIP
jgi:hypothetical protein